MYTGNFHELHAKRKAWLELNKVLEDAREDLDRLTAAFLRSEGPAPSRAVLDELDDLLYRASEARGEVDQLILENAT